MLLLRQNEFVQVTEFTPLGDDEVAIVGRKEDRVGMRPVGKAHWPPIDQIHSKARRAGDSHPDL